MPITKSPIGRDTVIEFKITGVEAAKIYAILGKTTGTSSTLWSSLSRLFEQRNGSYRAYQNTIRPISGTDILNYSQHEKEWLNTLFGKESFEEYVDVEDIKSQINVLQAKLESVKLIPTTATQIKL